MTPGKKITSAVITLLGFIFVLSLPLFSQNYTDGPWAEKRIENGIPVIVLTSSSGDYYELGKKHGEFIRKTEPGVAGNMKRFMKRQQIFFADVDMDYRLELLEKNVPKRFLDEMRGFADGIDGVKDGGTLTYKDVLFINLAGEGTRALPMCSGAALYNVKKGKAFVGRNLDWADMGSYHKASGATAFRIGDRAYISFGITGVSTISTGINRYGVFCANLTALQKEDRSFLGHYPVIIAIREVMEEARSADDAVKMLKVRDLPYSCNFLIADKNRALVLEKSGKQAVIRKAENKKGFTGLIVTNHFINSKNSLEDENSVIRYKSLKNMIDSDGIKADVQSAENLLSLCENKDNPIFNRLTKKNINRSATLLSAVFDPIDMKAYVWFARSVPGDEKPSYSKLELFHYMPFNGSSPSYGRGWRIDLIKR